jgi:hypothetical protein
MSINLRQLTLVALSTAILPAMALSTFVKPAAAAGYLVQGGTVAELENTSRNANNFAVKVIGGTGACSNQVILFSPNAVANANIYSRSFTMALEAFKGNYKVNIYDYISPGTAVSCNNGGQIVLTK